MDALEEDVMSKRPLPPPPPSTTCAHPTCPWTAGENGLCGIHDPDASDALVRQTAREDAEAAGEAEMDARRGEYADRLPRFPRG